jgi:hypothetical protein
LRRTFLFLLFSWAFTTQGQEVKTRVDSARATSALEIRVTDAAPGKRLHELLADIQSKRGVKFYFRPEWIESITLNDNYDGRTVAEMLDQLFQQTNLAYVQLYPHVVVILQDPTREILHRQALERATLERKKVEQRVVGKPGDVTRGKLVTISGTVVDSKTKAPMAGATIRVSDSQSGTSTDQDGKYSITVGAGARVISISFLDYEEKILDLTSYEDATIDIELVEAPVYLDEIVITDRALVERSTARLGQTQIAMKEIRLSPTMLGEVDLIRSVQLLPGVTTVGEAASGFNVRGGSVDQNLVLYDGMPIFNGSHVFGLLSTFNPEAVRDVSFYRGGIPAEFGGRASSVLDIRAREGDYDKWNGNAGIGLITANFMINGPITKGKSSLSASFRSTYSDWLIHSIKSDYGNLQESSVFFYDGTLKYTHRLSPKTKLSLTGYSSRDKFRLIGDSTYSWRNILVNARLDHQFESGLTGEFVLGESIYGYDFLFGESTNATELGFSILSTNAKAGFNHQLGKHKLNFGAQATWYRLNPGHQQPASPESTTSDIALGTQNAVETALYGADTWSPGERTFIEAGLRLPMFTSLGPASVRVYSGHPGLGDVVDTIVYGAGEPIKTYVGIEPRLAVRWMLTPLSSIKAGYSRVYQFLHLVTNTTSVSPVDIWQPSGPYFKPQIADQFSIGYFKDFKENKYGASAEAFYKHVDNLVDFKDGAKLILNPHIETELLQGKGWSYGVETSLSKNAGRVTGSANYTYARSFRQFAGPTDQESIGEGKRYPSNYDQPHIVNVIWKVAFTKRYYLTGNFTYHTGRPVTIPLAAIMVDNIPVSYFSERNQYRVPDYHRLDLALVIEGTHKRKKIGDGTWVFSLYNVYARKNVYTIFFRGDEDGILKPYQLSIIGTVLPSISYNLRF